MHAQLNFKSNIVNDLTVIGEVTDLHFMVHLILNILVGLGKRMRQTPIRRASLFSGNSCFLLCAIILGFVCVIFFVLIVLITYC